jgi:Extended Signal Peptide of Type V secretion system
MNHHTHRTIYNQACGCLMAVAETAKSSGKASGESRPSSKQTRRKARFTWSLQGLKIAIAIGLQAMLLLPSSYAAPTSQSEQGLQVSSHSTSINSALTRKSNERYAASQLGTDPVAPLLAFSGMPLAFGVSPQLFAASQNLVEQAAQLTSDIVWLVETEVSLPNGSKVKALAPQVYLSKLSAKNIRPDGNLIAAAGNIDLQGLKGFSNAGTLTAGKNLNLQTDGTLNNAFGSLSSGRMMSLTAGKDIELTSSTVRAGALSLTAGQDILLATATQTTKLGDSAASAPPAQRGLGGLRAIGGCKPIRVRATACHA